MITVRSFAAAAEAAGTVTEQVGAGTAGELRAALAARHGAGLERVLDRCALLHEGQRLDVPAGAVPPGGRVDVLPPFAGG
ncbi:MoaD/ThiS family protein [Cellulosimicrobium cellulans]|uniref:MoaD/ThiS family protein n=1 Tax=Cellulosimicrobium cellulans TaxID=1710 RepID=UPI00130DF435|nr:MoaD/ThiS family protein [Cellulosimicrobium cellulans]